VIRPVVAIFAVLTTLLLAVPALAGDVAFHQQPFPVGGVMDHDTTMQMAVDMKMVMPDGQAMNMAMKMKNVEDKRIEILEADGSGPSKMKLTYEDRSESMEMFGTPQSQPNPVNGQTYVLTRGLGSTVESEPAATGAVLEEVRDEFDDLANLRSFVSNLQSTKVPVGEEVDLAMLMKAGLLGGGSMAPGVDLEKGVMKLTGTRKVDGEECGVFSVEMVMKGTDPATNMVMTMEMNGEILVSVDKGWLRKMEFAGPVTMSGSTTEGGVTMNMEATGTFSIVTTLKDAGK